MGTRKIAPAIAAGCTMVVKPAQQTPLSMLALAGILEEAGLPGGVLNVITAHHSGAVIEPLLKDPRTRKLSFTGSTEVGRTLIAQSAEQILRVSMELGGNAPFLVFEDADLDAAVEGALIGEAAQRRRGLHRRQPLPRARVDRRRVRARAWPSVWAALKVGRGTEPGVDIGPLIDDRQRAIVASWSQDAVAARRQAAVRRRAARTRPRLLLRSDRARRRARRRPACCARRSSVPSRPSPPSRPRSRRSKPPTPPSTGSWPTSTRATWLARSVSAEAIEAGMVGVNQGIVSNPAAPFGGVKQSGFGREGGFEGIGEYLETKYVALSI